jgi:PAS domain S-box-containing protein
LHEWIVVTASLLFLNAAIMVFNRVRRYDLKKCYERKRKSEDRYRIAFLISPDAVNITRLCDGCYLEVNDGFVKALGWSREDAVGKTSLELNIWRNPQNRQRLVAALQRDGHCAELEAEFVGKDGGVMTGLISANIMRIQGEHCMLSVTRDITERKSAQGQINSLAFYDPLTELPNRRLLNDRLKQAIASSARNERYGGTNTPKPVSCCWTCNLTRWCRRNSTWVTVAPIGYLGPTGGLMAIRSSRQAPAGGW